MYTDEHLAHFFHSLMIQRIVTVSQLNRMKSVWEKSRRIKTTEEKTAEERDKRIKIIRAIREGKRYAQFFSLSFPTGNYYDHVRLFIAKEEVLEGDILFLGSDMDKVYYGFGVVVMSNGQKDFQFGKKPIRYMNHPRLYYSYAIEAINAEWVRTHPEPIVTEEDMEEVNQQGRYG